MRALYLAVILVVLVQVVIFGRWYLGSRVRVAPEDRELVAELRRSDGGTVHKRIVAILAAGEQKRAEGILDAVISKHRKDVRLAFLRAVCHQSRFHGRLSAWWFRRVIALAPKSAEARCAQLVMDLDEGRDVDRNFAALVSLVDARPRDAVMRWALAIPCCGIKRYEEGARQYGELEKEWVPGPTMFNKTYADVLHNLHRYEEALPHRFKTVEQEPAGFSYQGLAITLREMGRAAEALRFARKAAAMNPSYDATWTTWGLALADLGRDAEAVEKYRIGTKYGNEKCMFNIAWHYDEGRGVPQDYALALHWYLQAMSNGHDNVYGNIGSLYNAGGPGVPRDLTNALTWYLKGAEHQDVDCMNTVGFMYRNGKGGESNLAEAVRWFESASSLGSSYADNSLGYMYMKGTGVPKDYAKSLRHFLLAAQRGNDDPELPGTIGWHYMNGHGVTKDLVKAKEWLEKAISNGPPARVYDLARICEDSDPAVRDLARADALHRRLADGGYMLSQNRMAWWLSTAADPGLRDGKEAVRYALMSVAQKRIAGTVDTLAAAYARDGQFEKAVEAQREAIELLGKSADPDTVADYLTRLRLYEAGTPYTGPTLQVEPGKPEVRG